MYSTDLSYTLTTAAGIGNAAICDSLREGVGGLRPNDFAPAAGLPTWVGRIAALDGVSLPDCWRDYDCRNNRLAGMALEQDGFSARIADARRRYGAN